jgi:hypothetical protein
VLQVEPAEDQPLVLGVQRMLAAGGVEDEGIALEEAGEFLVAGVPGAFGAPAGQAVGGDELARSGRLGEFGIHPVDVRLLDGELGRHRVGRHGAEVRGRRHDGCALLSLRGSPPAAGAAIKSRAPPGAAGADRLLVDAEGGTG